jgi:hypothetical protein
MACTAIVLYGCNEAEEQSNSNDLFVYDDNVQTRWSSPENMNGVQVQVVKKTTRRKATHLILFFQVQPYKLLDIKEQGMINRIWITINDRSPEMLRALKIEMFWDGADKPAVSVPFGDFFGIGLGQTTTFQNALFANAEGRSFNCFIKMPFKSGAKIQVVNEASKTLSLIFFDVDYSLLKNWDDDYLYFHAYWQRDTATKLAQDLKYCLSLRVKEDSLALILVLQQILLTESHGLEREK